MAKKQLSFKNRAKFVLSRLPLKKISPLFIVGGVLLAVTLSTTFKTSPHSTNALPEAQAFSGKSPSFGEVKEYLLNLSQKKGALYTYQALRVMELPPNMDFHLLGHIVSDQIYKEKGIAGMSSCTDDFRNACSHAIVVGIFSEKGVDALPLITEACRKAPGGSGAYTMCFHGLGHGILSFYGYRMEEAVSVCKKSGVTPFPNAEATQCISGAVMEIITGGDHDKAVWEVKHRHYLRDNPSPISLCQSSYMPREAAPLCFTYLTPYLFMAAGANLGNPEPVYFKKAFSFCEEVPVTDIAAREACFGGFGKEFVPLAQSRDIRKIDQMTETQLKTVYGWCQEAPIKEGMLACLTHGLSSLYWGGENDPGAAIKLCQVTDDPQLKNSCYRNLISMVFYFQRNNISAKASFCSRLPDPHRSQCETSLGRGT